MREDAGWKFFKAIMSHWLLRSISIALLIGYMLSVYLGLMTMGRRIFVFSTGMIKQEK